MRKSLDSFTNPLQKMTLDEVTQLVNECRQQGKTGDLSRRDLRNLDLRGTQNLGEYNFSDSDLQGVHFPRNMQRAKFFNAMLQGAHFDKVNVENADFTNACLSGAHLWTETLQHPDIVKLEWARWDDGYTIGNEAEAQDCQDKNQKVGLFRSAGGIYRQLKQIYQRYGRYDLAGQFYYREMECTRNQTCVEFSTDKKNWETGKRLFDLWLSSWSFGYGERPWNLVRTGLLVFVAFACIYFFAGLFPGRGGTELLLSLYFSAVSFTAVGYGSWLDAGLGWPKYLGAVEAILGIFIMALFLVTFARRFTR